MRSCVTAAALVLVLVGASAAATACDKEPTKTDPSATKASETASASAAPTASAAPAPPPKPQLAIDDSALFLAGNRIEATAPDQKGRIGSFLSDKPVAGETLVLNAARDTKMPRMTTLFSELITHRVKAVEVHTPQRDRSDGVIVFVTNQKPSDCSAVGWIAKDSAINTWPVGGAPADRFTHGMAGPDLTRGSEGLRKRALACDSPVFFVAADDNVTWGLTFDLARAVLYPDDAGLPKARSASLLVKTPVPGHKVDVDVTE